MTTSSSQATQLFAIGTDDHMGDQFDKYNKLQQEQGLLNRSFRCHKCNTSMELKDRAAGDKKT